MRSVPKSAPKTTTFPTMKFCSHYSTILYIQNAQNSLLYNKDPAIGRTTRPTVIISSDNEEVETVSDHVRV